MGPAGPRPGWLGRKGLHCTLLMRWSRGLSIKCTAEESKRKVAGVKGLFTGVQVPARPIVGGGRALQTPNEKFRPQAHSLFSRAPARSLSSVRLGPSELMSAVDTEAERDGEAASPTKVDANSAGHFPSKQQQNDEAQAPLDDQERRAVQKRLQRRADEKRAEALANGGSMSVRDRSHREHASGAYTPKGSWLTGRLTGRRTMTARGLSSSRSAAQSTARSILSTSRSMMTTARSDVATGRYNDVANQELTEPRQLEMARLAAGVPDDEQIKRATAPRTGKTPRKTAASTAAGLRAGLLRRGAALRGASRGRTPRTARLGHLNNSMYKERQPGERPAHGG
jgi:hypothetical protein